MQSNRKNRRFMKVLEARGAWLDDYPKSWRPQVLHRERRSLNRQDLEIELQDLRSKYEEDNQSVVG